MGFLLSVAAGWCALAVVRAAVAFRMRDRLPARVTASAIFPLLRPWRMRLRVDGIAMDARIRIRRESLPEKWGWMRVKPNRENWHSDRNDIRFRDFSFDDRIDVRGPRDEAVSVLSNEARRLLVGLFDVDRGRLREGALRCDALLFRASRRAKEVDRLVAILEERTRRGVRACLVEMALKDEMESVRLIAIGYLQESFGDAPELVEAYRIAADTGKELWYRVGGIGSLPEEEKAPRWRAMLEDPKEWQFVRSLALTEVAQRVSASDAEELCLRFLERENPEIALEALRLLGEKYGTARALPAMGALSGWDAIAWKNMTLGDNTNVGAFAKTAVTALRSRLGIDGDDAGRLALAQGAGGALSAPQEPGAVSVAKKETAG